MGTRKPQDLGPSDSKAAAQPPDPVAPGSLPAAVREQLVTWASAGGAPTYASLEQHLLLLTTVGFVLQANMLSGDAVRLAFRQAAHVLTCELGFSPAVVEACLAQLQRRGQEFRAREPMVLACGSL